MMTVVIMFCAASMLPQSFNMTYYAQNGGY